MKKYMNFLISFIIILIPLNAGASSKIIKYDFNEVEATYSAKFTAMPEMQAIAGKVNNNKTVAQSIYESVYESVYGNPSSEHWISELAGGQAKPIEVLYGKVNLKKDGITVINDEFIKVSGINGSQRFLSNSASYEYYEGTNKLRKAKTLFWSGKQIEVNQVVKDYTGSVKSIIMYREFDINGNIICITLSFPPEDEKGSTADKFWNSNSKSNSYTAVMETYKHSGEVAGGVTK